MAEALIMDQVPARLAQIREQMKLLTRTFDPEELRGQVEGLEAEMQRPGFWDEQAKAAEISAKHARAQRRLRGFEGLQADVADLDELVEMAAEDEEMASELASQVESIKRRLAELEEERLFSGEYDAGNASSPSTRGPGGPNRRTGPRCCCACTCAGRKGATSRWR